MTDTPRPKLDDVSVVFLCHDRPDEIILNLPPRLDDVRHAGLDLVVVHNASDTATRELVKGFHNETFTLLLPERNLGVAAGRNLGWSHTVRPVIITLDEDLRISTDGLRMLADALLVDARIGIVHPIPVDPLTQAPQIAVTSPPHDSTNFHGACYAVRREVIDRVGMHDERCDFGGEELDLSIRTRRSGWEVRQLPSLTVSHNALRRTADIAAWRRVRWIQNRTRVVIRWFPVWRGLSWTLAILAAELRSAVRGRSAAEPLQVLIAWFRGVVEGIREHERTPKEITAFYSTRLGWSAVLARRR